MSIGKRVYGTFASDDDADGESAPLGGRVADTEFYTTMAHVQTVGRAGQSANGSAPMSEQEKLLILQFMRVLVYCNTAMIMPGEGGTEEVQNNEELVDRLQAESPDEVALVQCASEHCGVLLKKRSNHEIVSEGLNKYSVNGEGSSVEERVELIAVNEFDSDRKMMSVVVKVSTTGKDKQVTHKNLLLCKGADSSILRHCKDLSQGPYTDYCKTHINMFASTGLRTLALSYREVSESELEIWMKEYNAASNNITGRAEAMAKVAQKIEQNMILIGALGIEDELQDGVPEAIRIMHSAGINVWMITGDKAETAIAIGKKCALVQPGKNHIERVLSLSNEALRQRIMDLHSYVLSRRDNTIAAPKTSGLG
jgi:magnesium-transporting ATPase (P-type)